MSVAPLVLIATLAGVSAAEPDPTALVAKLGSADPAKRAEAAGALVALGREALPALRKARVATDCELRERASSLWDTIQRGLLTRPSLVRLGYENRPLADALEDLQKQTGLTLRAGQSAGLPQVVNDRDPAPVPFWEAVDRLGRAGHVRHDPGPRRDDHGNDPRASAIRLVDGDPPASTTYSGPLRIHLFATHRHRDLSFQAAGGLPGPTPFATSTVEVQAFAEPGRFIDPDALPPWRPSTTGAGRCPRARAGPATGRALPSDRG